MKCKFCEKSLELKREIFVNEGPEQQHKQDKSVMG